MWGSVLGCGRGEGEVSGKAGCPLPSLSRH